MANNATLYSIMWLTVLTTSHLVLSICTIYQHIMPQDRGNRCAVFPQITAKLHKDKATTIDRIQRRLHRRKNETGIYAKAVN